jgi:hypothetical protein
MVLSTRISSSVDLDIGILKYEFRWKEEEKEINVARE